MKSREHEAQAAVIRWADSMRMVEPDLQLLFAIPNAAKRSIGLAARMKSEGLRAGVPDLFLPVPTADDAGNWQHGLFIEMKIRPNRVTETQKTWHTNLKVLGYRVEVCWSEFEAIQCIKGYLGIK